MCLYEALLERLEFYFWLQKQFWPNHHCCKDGMCSLGQQSGVISVCFSFLCPFISFLTTWDNIHCNCWCHKISHIINCFVSLIEYYMMVPASKILPKYYFSVFYVIVIWLHFWTFCKTVIWKISPLANGNGSFTPFSNIHEVWKINKWKVKMIAHLTYQFIMTGRYHSKCCWE